MEKAELIKDYRKAEKEVEVKEKAFAELENRLAQSQEALNQAKGKLTSTEEYQQSSNLTSVKEIEGSRVAAQKAKVDYENHNQVVENLEIALQNSEPALHDLRTGLSQQKSAICIKLADEKAEEIEKITGTLFEEYTALTMGIDNKPIPFDFSGIPNNLKFLAARACDLKGIQAGIFAKL